MKRLSDSTEELFALLYREQQSLLKKHLLGGIASVPLIHAIGDSQEPDAILRLAPLLYKLPRRPALEAAASIERLLRALPSARYAALDQQMRRWSGYEPLRLKPSEVDGFSRFHHFSWVPLCMASMSANGYAREKSITMLREHDNPRILPFLLLRANDWVEQVRKTAFEGIRRFLKPSAASHLIENLPLLLHLGCGRARDKQGVKNDALQVLMQPESRPSVLEALSAQEAAVRRTCWRLALALDDIDLSALLHKGLADCDVLVRAACADRLCAPDKDVDKLELAELALSDPHALIRQKAVAALCTLEYSKIKSLLCRSLCDPNPSIREMCRSAITRADQDIGPAAFIAHYKNMLARESGRRLSFALAGLSETGGKPETNAIAPLLDHELPSVRRTAIRALSRLAGDDYREEFFYRITNDTKGVSKEAAAAIAALKPFPTAGRLRELLESAGSSYAKLNILSLINMLPKWDSVPLLLYLLADPSPEVSAKSKAYLELWTAHFNRGATFTDAAALDLARSALDGARHLLDPQFAKLLEFHFK